MMPKIISKSHNPHVLETTPENKNEKDLVKDTDVVPVKYPPKVKLENFHNSKVPKLGKFCIPQFMRALGFL